MSSLPSSASAADPNIKAASSESLSRSITGNNVEHRAEEVVMNRLRN
jgi:hypothetical protein